MYSWLVPHVVFPLWERMSGRRLWTEVQRLETLQWRPAEELEQRAVTKLRRLLEHARSHVPHYRTCLDGVDVETIRTIEDLARVPITTRAELRRGFPGRVTAQNLPVRRRRLDATSGSTGQPLEFYLDRAGDDTWLASYLFFLGWAGTAPWETQVMVSSGQHFLRQAAEPGPLLAWIRRVALGRVQVWLPGADTDARILRDRVARLRGPYFVWAYASYATGLAREMLADGIALPAPPRVVISVAETLSPPEAGLVRQAFRCPVVSHYSCREIPRFAQSCPDRPDRFHVNSERAIVRIVRDDGRAAGPGERGRVIVTDLANDVMPFINYDLGDLAVASEPCPCGRGLPTLGAVDGRAAETIVLGNGRVVSATALGAFLLWACEAIPYVREYQAVQVTRDAVELRVVPTDRFSDDFARRLTASLGELLGPGAEGRVVAVDDIEREASGKRLAVKSALAPPGPAVSARP
jgi:phenylacetate-CoA ligase